MHLQTEDNMKNLVRAALLILTAALVGWVSWKRSELRNFPGIISAFYSKEMCSCMFVVGQTEEFCNNYARQYVPIQGAPIVDRDKKTIQVRGLFVTSEAEYTGEKNGCVLRPAH